MCVGQRTVNGGWSAPRPVRPPEMRRLVLRRGPWGDGRMGVQIGTTRCESFPELMFGGWTEVDAAASGRGSPLDRVPANNAPWADMWACDGTLPRA